MPYGEQAIAAAKSRENLPPVYKPRGGEASGSGSGPGTGTVTEHGTRSRTEGEDEPTITIRRPMLLTPGELAQRKKSESPESDSPEPDRSLDPREEPIESVLQDSSMTISEEPLAIPEALNGQESRGDTDGEVDDRVEPRARLRESPHGMMDDGRRESVMTTNSFVTATEGQGDSSPPTPTAETYQSRAPTPRSRTQSESQVPGQHQAPDGTPSRSQAPTGAQSQAQAPTGAQDQPTRARTQSHARTQTVLIPESRDALHPELTLVPATPIG